MPGISLDGDHRDAEQDLRPHRARRPRRRPLLVRAEQAPGSASTCAPPAGPRPRPSRAASRSSGWSLTSMVISGAVAGLVGMPLLFGQDYAYGDTFQSGLGFAGIAIALLGRNNAVGIVFAALLWAYLDAQGNGLQIDAGRVRPAGPGHPGRHRPVRRHRLRAGAPGRGPRWSSGGSPRSWRPPERPRPRRKGRRHERPGTGHHDGPRGAAASLVEASIAPAGSGSPSSAARSSSSRRSGSSPGPTTSTPPAPSRPRSRWRCRIGLAGLGGLWSERAGVVNIGLEGMMILGTWGGAFFGYYYGPWVGILGAILLGVVGGAVHALATVIFGVDHIVSGVAINLLGAGAGAYLAVRTFSGLPGRRPDPVPAASAAAVHQRPRAERLARPGRGDRDLAGLRHRRRAARRDDERQHPQHHRRPAADPVLVDPLAYARSGCGSGRAARLRRPRRPWAST